MVLQSKRGDGPSLPAIQFQVPGDASAAIDRFEKIAYRPQWNYWNGSKRLQLIVEETVA